jgi:hypothetical protein
MIMARSRRAGQGYVTKVEIRKARSEWSKGLSLCMSAASIFPSIMSDTEELLNHADDKFTEEMAEMEEEQATRAARRE